MSNANCLPPPSPSTSGTAVGCKYLCVAGWGVRVGLKGLLVTTTHTSLFQGTLGLERLLPNSPLIYFTLWVEVYLFLNYEKKKKAFQGHGQCWKAWEGRGLY